MSLRQLIHAAESRLLALGQVFFDIPARVPAAPPAQPPTPAALQQACRAELAEAEAELCEVRERLARNQAEVALYPSRIQSSLERGKSAQAVRQALELDSLRAGVADDLARLPGLEQRCWSLRFRLKQSARRSRREARA